MSDFYAEMAGVATELLTEFKQGVVTLTRITHGEPDPDTPWIPGEPSTQTFDLSATVKTVEDKFIDGSTILATDREVMAAGFGSEPQPGDVLTIDGTNVQIVRQMRIPAAGTLIAWRWIVRG